jgi:adenylosuccinate synthase
LPTAAEPAAAERLRQVGDEYGATTGRPRRCGWFDAVVVRYAARVNGLTDLAVTKLDILDGFDELPVCTGYLLDREPLADMPADTETLGRVQPVYERRAGWGRPTSGARRLADLPPQARAYLDRIEALVGTPVTYVSVGSRRDQIIGLS